MNEVAARIDLVLAMDMQPGDVQLVNNRYVLHDRIDYVDYPEMDRRRLLLRVWLTMPGWIKYPPTFRISTSSWRPRRPD